MVTLLRPLPQRLAGGGVLVLGLAWSLGVALANWEQIRAAELPLATAALLTTVGGTLTVAGIWLGASAVAWAMGRLLGGAARFVQVLFAVSAATPPLWIAAPALTLMVDSSAVARAAYATLGAVATLGFVALLVAALRAVEAFSWQRACGCAALTVLFCTSYLSLT